MPHRGLVKVGVWSPAREPDSWVHILTPPLGNPAVALLSVNLAGPPFLCNPSVKWGRGNHYLPQIVCPQKFLLSLLSYLQASAPSTPAQGPGEAPWGGTWPGAELPGGHWNRHTNYDQRAPRWVPALWFCQVQCPEAPSRSQLY